MWKKILYKSHRILGSGLSVLFLLWFLSGFVMIYHNFPKINETDKFRGLSAIDDSCADEIYNLVVNLSETRDSFDSFLLKCNVDSQFQIEYSLKNNYFIVDNKRELSNRQNLSNICSYASRINTSSIIKIDTLYDLDRWVPYDKHNKDFPLYKFYYGDKQKSELYVSSQTGEGVQYSDSKSRFWAWLGAIPHWLYIFNLRHYTGLWKNIVIGLSGIGCLMCITGIMIGVRAFYKRYKRRKMITSPYKSIYKWHHLLGFVFGIFVFTFSFSGMMSLQKIPQCIIKTHNPKLETDANYNPLKIAPSKFPLDCRVVLEEYKGRIQKLEWCAFGNKPYYKAIIDDSLLFFDASIPDKLARLYLTEEDIENRISVIHPDDNVTIILLKDYDNYYIHKRYTYPLPVYKVMVDDLDKSVYYINPETADSRYFNKSMRVRKWTFQALHSFSIKYFLDRPILWNFLMWTTMIGGTLVSITGVYLGVKAIRLKIRKW